MSASSQQKNHSLAEWVIPDPGASGTIPNDISGTCNLDGTNASGVRTLNSPAREGLTLTICEELAGSVLLTVDSGTGYNEDGDYSVTFTNAGDFITFRSIRAGANTFVWRIAEYEGVAGPSQTIADLTASVLTASALNTGSLTVTANAIMNTSPPQMRLGHSVSANCIQHTTETTLTATEIVGNSAGDINHADGAILVAAAGADAAHEFVSAVLIYEYATAAYESGGDDTVINVGVTGSQVAATAAIAKADLWTASADKIVQVNSLSAADRALVANNVISLYAGTGVTQPGTAAGTVRCVVTYRTHTLGLA